MKRLVEYRLKNGNRVVIEVEEAEEGGSVRVGRGDKVEQARETFEEALNKVLPVAESMVEKIHAISNHLDEIEISFGINLNTVVGAVVASAGVGANFGVVLHWSASSSQQSSS